MKRTLLAILKILAKENKIIGSKEIAKRLKLYGLNLSERTVRYHLKIFDERGLTKVFGKEGRSITEKGREELEAASTVEKVGFIINKIETLKIIKKTFRIMENVFNSQFVMIDRILILEKR